MTIRPGLRVLLAAGSATAVLGAGLVLISGTAGAAGPCSGGSASGPASSSASPSATATATISPSGSASASASPTADDQFPIPRPTDLIPIGGGSSPSASASASATPTATVSPSPSGSCTPTVRVSPGTITAGQPATVSGTAAPGSRIDLFSYSRPSTTYRRIRTGAATDNGTFTFAIKPTTNTRLYVTSTDSSGTSTSANVPLPVRTAVSLSATRTGTRAYRFTGSTSPRAKGQLVTLYRGSTKVAQTRTAAPGSRIDLFSYSRPSTTYRRIRTGAATDNGTFTFTIKPTTNTRLYVTSTDGSGTGTSATAPLPVRTAVSLSVTRTGTRAYRFTGSTSPRAKGQLVTLYRGNTKVAQTRTASDGTYVLTKTFTGSGTFDFHTGASATTSSTAGSSRNVRVAIR